VTVSEKNGFADGNIAIGIAVLLDTANHGLHAARGVLKAVQLALLVPIKMLLLSPIPMLPKIVLLGYKR
jgi:hypothetical protein